LAVEVRHLRALYSQIVNQPPETPKKRGRQNRLMRPLAERAFSRAAGAPLIGGNAVRLLLNAGENFSAWLDAIRSAQRSIYFENYIIRADATGTGFRNELARRAGAGITVRVVLDWFGSLTTPRGFWEPLVRAGGTVRYHNPPNLDGPLDWLGRDHRKLVVVDGATGYVSGLCVSDAWLGNPARKIEEWRDTGIELRGPAVADLSATFADVWARNGDPIPDAELAANAKLGDAGDVSVRVVATAPDIAGLYRLDLLIASIARERLWLTDAYFAGTSGYVQALRAAAGDGVDVRLLVPGGSDLPWLRPLTTAGYRPLLEAGVRVFEWNGSMIHAKTAVADERWARVGSTNLNLMSWLWNYELDVAIEDEGIARQMAGIYERDLTHSTEVILKERRRVRLPSPDDEGGRSRPGRGSLARVTAGALRITRSVSAAMAGARVIEASGVRSLALTAVMALALSMLAILFPSAVAWPIALVAGVAGIFLLLRAWRLRAAGKRGSLDSGPSA
jgi:cardiolipin synthase